MTDLRARFRMTVSASRRDRRPKQGGGGPAGWETRWADDDAASDGETERGAAGNLKRALWFRSLALLLAAVLLATLFCEARAAGKITLQLREVLATDRSPGAKEIDPSLADLKTQFDKYNYRVYKNAGTEKKELSEGEEAVFNLAAEPGFVLRATPTGAGDQIQVAISLKDPKGKEVLGTRIKIKDGGTSIVYKDLENKTGAVILAFTAKRS